MNSEIQAILDNTIIGTLATINEDGSPWATPLHMVSGQNGIYWFSADSTEHSKNISRDARVSLVLPVTNTADGLKGVYINGNASKLDEKGHQNTLELFEERLGFVPPAFKSANAYLLPFGTLDEKKSTGNCWYFYN